MAWTHGWRHWRDNTKGLVGIQGRWCCWWVPASNLRLLLVMLHPAKLLYLHLHVLLLLRLCKLLCCVCVQLLF
jgi:hypothetical protein